MGFDSMLERTVLLVDDRPDARYMMVRALASAGFDVLEAATGGHALRLALLTPDAIVLDIALPDIDGFEVVRRLKANAATQHIPVVHKTAVYGDDLHRRRGLAAGAEEYLVEPFAPQALIAAVRRVLGDSTPSDPQR
jgi:DNA-binding response OmpR family regulator